MVLGGAQAHDVPLSSHAIPPLTDAGVMFDHTSRSSFFHSCSTTLDSAGSFCLQSQFNLLLIAAIFAITLCGACHLRW
jgi:hypothetical protein